MKILVVAGIRGLAIGAPVMEVVENELTVCLEDL